MLFKFVFLIAAVAVVAHALPIFEKRSRRSHDQDEEVARRAQLSDRYDRQLNYGLEAMQGVLQQAQERAINRTGDLLNRLLEGITAQIAPKLTKLNEIKEQIRVQMDKLHAERQSIEQMIVQERMRVNQEEEGLLNRLKEAEQGHEKHLQQHFSEAMSLLQTLEQRIQEHYHREQQNLKLNEESARHQERERELQAKLETSLEQLKQLQEHFKQPNNSGSSSSGHSAQQEQLEERLKTFIERFGTMQQQLQQQIAQEHQINQRRALEEDDLRRQHLQQIQQSIWQQSLQATNAAAAATEAARLAAATSTTGAAHHGHAPLVEILDTHREHPRVFDVFGGGHHPATTSPLSPTIHGDHWGLGSFSGNTVNSGLPSTRPWYQTGGGTQLTDLNQPIHATDPLFGASPLNPVHAPTQPFPTWNRF